MNAKNTNGKTRKVNTSYAREDGQQNSVAPYPIRSGGSKSGSNSPKRQPEQNKPRTSAKRKQTRKERPESNSALQRRLSRGELRRRRRHRKILAVTLVLLLVIAGSILSVTVLFKVKKLRVENLDKSTPADTGIYTEDAILGALAIPMEENMFQFSVKEREQAMALQLPYLETIRIRRSLPSTVVVQVEPAVESWNVWQPEGWLVLSHGFKIMEQRAEASMGLPIVYGLPAVSLVPGERFALKPKEAELVMGPYDQQDPEAYKKAMEKAQQDQEAAQKQENQKAVKHLEDVRMLMDLLEKEELLDGVTVIDLREENESCFVYENRIKVLLGTFNNLEYKLGAVAKLLRNETGEFLSKTDRGILDVSHQLDDQVVRIPFNPSPFEIVPPSAEQQETPSQEQPPPPAEGEVQEDTGAPVQTPAPPAQ